MGSEQWAVSNGQRAVSNGLKALSSRGNKKEMTYGTYSLDRYTTFWTARLSEDLSDARTEGEVQSRRIAAEKATDEDVADA